MRCSAAVSFGVIFLVAFTLGAPLTSSATNDPVNQLIDYALSESLAYDRLADMTDRFGPRLSGTIALENAIDWVVEKALRDGFDSVITENVQVPHWVRGREWATVVSPRAFNLSMLGLGLSIGTGPTPITAEVVVVKSFDELAARASEIPGKIVVYNAPWVSYSENGVYRRQGALEAQKYGAVASITRSIAPFSLYTPHTGSSQTAKIPCAAITAEDADMIERMFNRGERVVISMYMEAHFLPDAISRNIIVEWKGYQYPKEYVVMGGHIDSWDVGVGALDDGGGAFVSWEALRLMAKYNLRPKRTIRVVFWTNEENGANGAKVFKQNREHEMNSTSWAFESDSGVFSPTGIAFTGSEAAYDIMVGIADQYLTRIHAGQVLKGGGGIVDVTPMCEVGVPCAGLNVAEGRRRNKTDSYFFYHHTNADSMTHLSREEVSLCVASMAAWTYAVADLDALLPR